MGEVIDLNAVRHGHRLFRLFLRQHGLPYFLAQTRSQDSAAVPRLDPAVLEATLSMAAEWITLRGAQPPNAPTRALLLRDLRRLLIAQIAHQLVQQTV